MVENEMIWSINVGHRIKKHTPNYLDYIIMWELSI